MIFDYEASRVNNEREIKNRELQLSYLKGVTELDKDACEDSYCEMKKRWDELYVLYEKDIDDRRVFNKVRELSASVKSFNECMEIYHEDLREISRCHSAIRDANYIKNLQTQE